MSKNYEEAFPGRIALGLQGLGTVNLEVIEARARELARADGRMDFNENDLANARQELVSAGDSLPPPPEAVDPALENLTSWDESAESSGTHTASQEPFDEANIAERLVQEGLAEADHEQRVSASESEPADEV